MPRWPSYYWLRRSGGRKRIEKSAARMRANVKIESVNWCWAEREKVEICKKGDARGCEFWWLENCQYCKVFGKYFVLFSLPDRRGGLSVWQSTTRANWESEFARLESEMSRPKCHSFVLHMFITGCSSLDGLLKLELLLVKCRHTQPLRSHFS